MRCASRGRQVSVATPAAGLAFTLSPLPPLRLGRLELPRQEVAVAVVKGDPAAAAELLARIDRATQRVAADTIRLQIEARRRGRRPCRSTARRSRQRIGLKAHGYGERRYGENATPGQPGKRRGPRRLPGEPGAARRSPAVEGDRFPSRHCVAGGVAPAKSPRSAPVPVRHFDHQRPPGQGIDQGAGGAAVGGVEVGVPFVEEIDPVVGVGDDLPQHLELALAGE